MALVPPHTIRPRTAQARLAKKREVGQLGDEIHNFETMRGLVAVEESDQDFFDEDVDPNAHLRKSWAERASNEEHEIRMEALAERFRARGSAQAPKTRTKHIEQCCLRPVSIRPQSAPTRLDPMRGLYETHSNEGFLNKRGAIMVDYWIEKHKAVIEGNAMAIVKMREEKIQMAEARRDRKRNALLTTMQQRRVAAHELALEQQHPYSQTKQAAAVRHEKHRRELEAAHKQEIFFLPPKLAASVPGLVREGRGVDYTESVYQVQRELERFELKGAHLQPSKDGQERARG